MNDKQGFSTIVLIIILTILAGGGYAIWKNQAPALTPTDGSPTSITGDLDTSDWKTYRNDEYGFEISYPVGYGPYILPPEVGFEGGAEAIVYWGWLDENPSLRIGPRSSYGFTIASKTTQDPEVSGLKYRVLLDLNFRTTLEMGINNEEQKLAPDVNFGLWGNPLSEQEQILAARIISTFRFTK